MRGDEPMLSLLLQMCLPRIPHMRGDEPILLNLSSYPKNVYPTCVGMNRFIKSPFNIEFSYTPHAWG